MKKTILMIDDNPADIELIKSIILDSNKFSGYELIEATNYRSGMHYYLNYKPCCTILDYKLDEGTGLELLQEFQGLGKLNHPVIFVTSQGDSELVTKAINHGAFMYFDKADIEKDLFVNTIEVAIEKYVQIDDNF